MKARDVIIFIFCARSTQTTHSYEINNFNIFNGKATCERTEILLSFDSNSGPDGFVQQAELFVGASTGSVAGWSQLMHDETFRINPDELDKSNRKSGRCFNVRSPWMFTHRR